MFDREWRPTSLPYAKPLPEILAAIGRYVNSISTASRRLQRAFPRDTAAQSAADVERSTGNGGHVERVDTRNGGKAGTDTHDESTEHVPLAPHVNPIYPPLPPVVETISEQTIVLTTHPTAPINGTSSRRNVSNSESTQHNGTTSSRGNGSRPSVRPSELAQQDGKISSSRGKGKGKESRATRAVLAYFGEAADSSGSRRERAVVMGAGGDVGSGKMVEKDVDRNRSRTEEELRESQTGSTASANVKSRRIDERSPAGNDGGMQSVNAESTRNRPSEREEPATSHAAWSTASVNPSRANKLHIPDQRHRLESPHAGLSPSIPQRATTSPARPTPPQRRKQRTSMPGYDILLRRVRERSRQLSETPAPERARSVSVGPQRTRRASMGPREVREPTPAPEVGTVVTWVPSPGSRFEVDEEGKLVYLGIAPRAATTTPVNNTPTAPLQRIGTVESLRKVQEAAETTRTPPGVGSPASSRRREFAKPLPRGNGSVAREGEGNAVVGPSQIPARAPSTLTSSDSRIQQKPITTFAPVDGASLHEVVTTTTPTPSTSSRKRPPPFDDSTVQRVPPQYRTGERRMSTSRAAVDFSRAQREASGRR